MSPDHFIHERDITDEQHAPKRNQKSSTRHLPRRYRICVALVLALFGLHLLAAGSGAGFGESLSGQQTAFGHTSLVAGPSMPLEIGRGAGAISGVRTNANAPAAVCLNPLDATCWLQNAAQWMAQQLMNALQPAIGAMLHGLPQRSQAAWPDGSLRQALSEAIQGKTGTCTVTAVASS